MVLITASAVVNNYFHILIYICWLAYGGRGYRPIVSADNGVRSRQVLSSARVGLPLCVGRPER